MTELTTIQITKKTKDRLEKIKSYRRETYDELVNKLIGVLEIVESEPELKAEVIEEMDLAQKELNAGRGISTEALAKKLGVKL